MKINFSKSDGNSNRKDCAKGLIFGTLYIVWQGLNSSLVSDLWVHSSPGQTWLKSYLRVTSSWFSLFWFPQLGIMGIISLCRRAACLYNPVSCWGKIKTCHLSSVWLAGFVTLFCLRMVLDVEDTAYLISNAVSMQRNESLRRQRIWKLEFWWSIVQRAAMLNLSYVQGVVELDSLPQL